MDQKLDVKLDDIIDQKKGARKGRNMRRPRRSGGAPAARSTALGVPDARVQRAKVAAATPRPALAAQPQAEKIQISGLPMDVNEAQVKDLFQSTVGPLRECALHYDAHGKSKGVATVTFSRRGDGTKAYETYNGRLIDGKKPMKIELLFDPTKLAVQSTSLASRVAPAAPSKVTPAPAEGGQRNGGRSRRGRGGAGGGARNKRPKKTAEDLDAEMEEYGKVVPAAGAAVDADTRMAE